MFEIDDILIVKQFEDMIDEYEISYGEPKVGNTYFSEPMRYMCGEKFTIKSITNYNGEPRYHSYEGIENRRGTWVIRDWMLENPQHNCISVSADEIMSLY